MIYELEPTDYHRVSTLVADLPYHLSIRAVIEGTVAGSIWVDDALAPQAAFTRTPEGQYLAGTPANLAFNRGLADLLLPMPSVGLTYHPDAWEPVFAALLACKFARSYPRRYYTIRRFLLPDWRGRVPHGYEMAALTPTFLARQDLMNLDDVREWISNWTDFARDGFGFCLVHGDTIVSHCIADCVSRARVSWVSLHRATTGVGDLAPSPSPPRSSTLSPIIFRQSAGTVARAIAGRSAWPKR